MLMNMGRLKKVVGVAKGRTSQTIKPIKQACFAGYTKSLPDATTTLKYIGKVHPFSEMAIHC